MIKRQYHGLVKTRAYTTWCKMKERCLNPTSRGYKNYGGRGITVCQSWQRRFMAFYRDMGDRPAGMTLERKENSKGYSKANCIWASRKAQARNTRTNRLLTCQGETRTIAEWAERTGLHPTVLRGRIVRLGWTDEEAILTPRGRPRRTTHWVEFDGQKMSTADAARLLGCSRAHVTYRLSRGIPLSRPKQPRRQFSFHGKKQTIGQWASQLGIPVSTLYDRLHNGWTVEEMLGIPSR